MKTKKYGISLLILTVLLAALLGACGKQTNAAGDDAVDQNIAITHIAETAYAAMTQTALVNPSTPTYTPTFAPSNTPLPTMQASPTQGLTTPTATLAFQQPPGGNSGATSSCDAASFVSDVTIPDGTQLSPGEKFTKTWEVKNTGSCTWNASYQIVFYGGEQMAAEAAYALAGGEVAPGEVLQVSVEMTAPSAAGEYTSWWVFRNANGENFFIDGGGIYAQIKVGTAATSAPTATGAPTATATTAPTNTAPTVSITAPTNGATGDTTTPMAFTAIASDAEDGSASLTIAWTYNGGTSMGTGASINYTFPAAGNYTVTVTVTDTGGLTGTDTVDVVIN